MPEPAPEHRITPLDSARAFAVMLGGPVLLAAAGATSLISTWRALRRGQLPPRPAAAGAAGAIVYTVGFRRWFLSWGATCEDRRKVLPGDEDALGPRGHTRAITIGASVEEVWPWLAQLGEDRGGFYSYDWLENLAGCRMRNAGEIHPEWQTREVGDTVSLYRGTGLPVTRFEPPRVLGIGGWGTFVLEPLGAQQARLLVRGAPRAGLQWRAYDTLLELPHFLMERRLLLGIKERAEQAHSERVPAAPRLSLVG